MLPTGSTIIAGFKSTTVIIVEITIIFLLQSKKTLYGKSYTNIPNAKKYIIKYVIAICLLLGAKLLYKR